MTDVNIRVKTNTADSNVKQFSCCYVTGLICKSKKAFCTKCVKKIKALKVLMVPRVAIVPR